MKYIELTSEEFENNILEPIAHRLISLAYRNSDFVCSNCLGTISILKNILNALDSEFAEPVIEEVNEILEG